MKQISQDRRRFLARVTAAIAQASGQALLASQVTAPSPGPYRLEREFKATQAKAISPDGGLLCLNRGTAIRRYKANFGGYFKRQATPARTLVLVEMGSWQEKLVRPLPESPWKASFQAGASRLLIERYIPQTQRLLLSPLTYEIEELNAPVVNEYFVSSMLCDSDRLLEHEKSSASLKHPRHEETLRLLEIGPNRATREIGVLPKGCLNFWGGAKVAISLDRFTLVHQQEDNRIVRRSTRNFEEIWAFPVAKDFEVAGLGISPNGEFVVCNLDGKESLSYEELSWRRQSILVLDGATGRLRHQIDRKREDYGSNHTIAITNDGSLIAIESGSDMRWNGKRADETLIQVIEAKTGRVLQTLLQCLTRDDDRLASGISYLQFTPDGQYLVSSGESTRIWKRVART